MAEFFHKNLNFTFALGLILAFCTCVLNLIAFATPYWLVSWPRLHSSFTKIGLWEVCFDGFVHPWDPLMQSYYGCWWILSTHMMDIRFWLLPAWFVFIQVVMSISTIMDLLLAVLSVAMAILRVKNKTENLRKGMHGQHGIKLLKCCIAFGFLNTIFFFVVSVLLAIFSEDPWWMPNPTINYFSWSYGLGILSGFASVFCALAYLFEMRSMNRDQFDETDMPVAPMISHEYKMKPPVIAPAYKMKESEPL